MKVVQICTNYKGGAGKAAFRLHNALLKNGVDSVFISLGKVPLIDIKGNKSILINTSTSLFRRVVHRIKKKLKLEHRFILELRSINPNLECLLTSLPFSKIKLHIIKEIKNADIVNIHGVTHILDYKFFFNKIKAPIVWTLHDINPIAGLFHLRTDEENNKIVANSLNEKVIDYKKSIYNNIKNGAIITPSNWLYKESIKRNMFKWFFYYEIANSIPSSYFKTKDRNVLRERHNIASNIITLLFVSSDLKDKNKGFDLLLEALECIKKDNIQLLIVGDGDVSVFNKYQILNFGYISKDEEMINIFNMADIFILPSRDENLPNVLLESLACGTPVVSFNIGGMPQYIKIGINGEIASEMTGESLGEAISLSIKNKNNYSRELIKDFACSNFNENKQATEYIKIYNQLSDKV
ncbi:glycosyltransferase involved in cell wall biosynthesis [Wenyingzhuangia heitensis]|uniref:Glycosyltransferase involved in cell wall biosynthesis n=1 Tax=Wenyingzhuangia heitensis TaxID=1487859 RepID=A0ABX0UD05_9FLAO|nr:glycosyltransferase [Wenyingzhuangia heitensis]NIJ45426.1 glycosyltransferase involved in cell wall biosynthesis [Wenyingzhuangia heitensis]